MGLNRSGVVVQSFQKQTRSCKHKPAKEEAIGFLPFLNFQKLQRLCGPSRGKFPFLELSLDLVGPTRSSSKSCSFIVYSFADLPAKVAAPLDSNGRFVGSCQTHQQKLQFHR